MPSSTKVATGAAMLGVCGIGGQAFLAGSRGAADAGVQTTLRGANPAHAQPTSTQSGVHSVTAAVGGVAVLGSVAVSARRNRGSCKRVPTVVCHASKETDAPASKETDAPAPPAFSKETQIGAQEPLGFWDPLGFCEDEEKFKDFRAKELKHGRLAMMGALGMLTQSVVQLPGMEGVPKGVTACLVGNGQVGFIATLAIISGLEAAVFVQDPKKEPGNFGNPLPLFDDYSDEMRAREINNGRIAMFSAIGIIVSGLYTGKPAIEQFSL